MRRGKIRALFDNFLFCEKFPVGGQVGARWDLAGSDLPTNLPTPG